MSLVPRNVRRTSPFYESLGLTSLHHSSLSVLEQVDSHYEVYVGRVGIQGLLQEYMVDIPNSLVVAESSTLNHAWEVVYSLPIHRDCLHRDRQHISKVMRDRNFPSYTYRLLCHTE